MGLRSILSLLFSAVLVIGLVVIIGSMAYLREQMTTLFPAHIAIQASQSLQLLLMEQAAGMFISIIVLLLVLFIVFGVIIIRPLKSLTQAMEADISTGERVSLDDLERAPAELKTLAQMFDGFVDKVETAHRNDTETSRIKSDFISTAAHQLRTPLTGIRWSLEALGNEPLTEGQKALVDSATAKSHDLVSIVGTLLDISAIESGKYKYKMAVENVSDLLIEVANDFAPLSGKSSVSLFYARPETPLPTVKIDRERVKWVLNNLVENAIRYTPAGGSVRLSADAGSGRVFIRIRDTGIGIPQKDRSNIFERFYRAENATAMQNAGNGLGLYIARTIAKDHGGDLNFADNKEGPGTTFILSLPSVT